jgi:NTP pyrophosphatase (non-canonical NTP hydrolase)
MYYLYHIPGKKIGLTSNLNKRVTKQQGYQFGEYEVLEASNDLSYISNKEIELQKRYGYKVDRQTYESLIKNNKIMKINVTEQTTTFPCPINKLKGNLMDNIGLKWATEHGVFGLDDQTIDWIIQNAKVSMFNINRCYIYNKAYAAEFLEIPGLIKEVTELANQPSVFDNIRSWAKERGIYDSGDSKTQYVKLMEEAGELAKALLDEDEPEIIDAIGDMVVVLTNLAKLKGLKIEECIDSAYREIANRKGKMINGTFVKQTL